MNSLPRWLISITPMPLPRQSSISSPARASTSAGSMAGPALKLKIRGHQWTVGCGSVGGEGPSWPVAVPPLPPPLPPLPLPLPEVALLDALHAGELLARVERDQASRPGSSGPSRGSAPRRCGSARRRWRSASPRRGRPPAPRRPARRCARRSGWRSRPARRGRGAVYSRDRRCACRSRSRSR